MKNYINLILNLGVVILLLSSCEDEQMMPVLNNDTNTYTNPSLINVDESETFEFTSENINSTYEVFNWHKVDYGLKLPVKYILQVSSDEEFSSSAEIAKTAENSASVTVKTFNNAVLDLGLTPFNESSVYVRVISTVDNKKVDTLKSSSIIRKIIPFKLSDCGNFCSIGIIGSATAGGWNVDTDMHLLDQTRVDKYTWTKTLYLSAGEVKFRAYDGWDMNWGGTEFPSGTGVSDGSNIVISTAGYYKVTFNDNTGEYTFTLLNEPSYSSIGVIGTATNGGWDSDTDLTQDTGNPHIWTGEITLSDGELKFRANDAWDVNWGGPGMPSGYGVPGGDNIQVTGGTYFIWFNDITGEYAFLNPADKDPYTTIGLIGDATPGGWDADTDLIQDPTNPYKYSKIISINEGKVKFRANDTWDTNWGGSQFPKGIGEKNGSDIVVESGQYTVFFHSGTGEYWFLN